MLIREIIYKLKTINDDGWIETVFICFFGLIICFFYLFFYIPSNRYFLFSAILGILIEQLVEWFGHGWIQHYPNKVLKCFNRRHIRHHRNPEIHHAIQPITLFLPVVFFILLPFILMMLANISNSLSYNSGWITIGFLLSHINLNFLHYDIHAQHKIIPLFIRNTCYYRKITFYHLMHHEGEKAGADKPQYRIYGLTNPWLDIFLEKIGMTKLMDICYPKFIYLLECILTHNAKSI